MRLEHMSDIPVDLKDQMQELSRLTTNMLTSDLVLTNDGDELHHPTPLCPALMPG